MGKIIEVNKVAQLKGHNASIYTVMNAQKPDLFLSGAGEGWVVQWDLTAPENGQLLAKVETNIFSLLYLEAQQQVVVGNMNGGIHWVDLDDPTKTKNIAHHQKGVFDIKKIDDHVYTLGGEGLLTKWSIEEARTLESFHITNQSLRAMDYSEKRNELAIGASDHHIYILDKTDLSIKNVIKKAHDNSVFCVKYSPDEKYLLSGGRDAHLKVWEVEKDYVNVSSQAAHMFTINSIAFHPKGHIFATASRDKTIKIWDAENWQLLKVLDTIKFGGHINSVNKLLWSTHKNQLISCSDDRSIIVWDIEMVNVNDN